MLRSGRIPFDQAIEYGIKMIELLKKLHSKNVIHGDAHLGNFAMRRTDPDELMLIDFGRAQYVGPTEIASVKTRSDFCTNTVRLHPFYTKWEIKGCNHAFRDDVYRAVEMTAVIMHGQSHLDYYKTLHKKNKAVYREIKNSGNFFNLPNTSTIGEVEVSQGLSIQAVTGITDKDLLQSIQSHLDEISVLAVYEDPQNPYSFPNHDLIIEKFKAILGALKHNRRRLQPLRRNVHIPLTLHSS
jgi:serine/threonine protein kinase